MKKRLPKLTYTQLIAAGFLGIIAVGSLLLCLPVSSKAGLWTPYINSLFTATSATCVTGLIIYDTFSHWSAFGQLVILLMIQIGGIGFMTIITLFSLILRRQISLHERKLIMQSAGSLQVGGVVSLIKKVALATFIIEGMGAILLSFRFVPEMGAAQGIYAAIFHSVSAFCNAGFDLMGYYEPFSSVTRYVTDPLVNYTLIALILLGGLGFFVWRDVATNKWHFSKYQLHTKLVLVMTAILTVGGTVLFLIFEYSATQADMSMGQRFMVSLFQAVTPRTAGFNTTDINAFSESGSMLTMMLMFIGGNPGSTAGGIKTTTLLVLVLSIVATCRHSTGITIFKRRMEDGIARQAAAIATIYMIAIMAASMIMGALEPLDMKTILFETISAAGTVGLTAGATQVMGSVSKIMIMILMFGGRVGGLTLALVLAEKRVHVPLERPTEKIMLG
jgi:trk system potassium uptake protein